MKANNAFLMMTAREELMDTLFFGTGQRPTYEKLELNKGKVYNLSTDGFEVAIAAHNKIAVNGKVCKSITEAKKRVQELLW